MPAILLEPAPFDNAVSDQKSGLMTMPWSRWIQLALVPRVETAAPVLSAPVSIDTETGAIGTTALVVLAAPGLYRISIYVRLTVAAGTSSSIAVNISTTDTLTVTQTTPAYTGNNVTQPQSDVLVVAVSTPSPITYSTIYSSVGAPAMEYALQISVEQII